MNILLVNPSQAEAYGRIKSPVQMHMGLAYLAAAVVEGNKESVEILDVDAENLSRGDFEERIRYGNIDIAGFTATTPTLFSSLALAKLIKIYSPDTLTVFGGIHPTTRPHEVISSDCVDVVVRGEGEITFKEIVNTVKGTRDLSNVEGIVFKKDGQIKETPARPLIKDLDSLPFPARHLFKNRRYTYPDALYKNTAPMITSRGCPGMCTFCDSNRIFERIFRARSAQNVTDEIEYLVKKMDTREIHIWDDNFTTIKKRVYEIRDEILKRNLKVKFAFPNGIRADFISKDVLSALKEMGMYSIAIGVESGSQEVLNKAKKGVRLEQVEEVFSLAKKMKIETWAFFIIGLPGENSRTFKKTIEFAKKIDPDIAKFHILKPYPGSGVYDYLHSKNFLLTEDYNQFGIHAGPVHRLEELGSGDMMRFQNMAYISFYLRPTKLAKQILRIKTLNRFVLNLQAALSLFKLVFRYG